MNYYPVFLRVAGRPCLVIGGGHVAEQKVESLLIAGAATTVISPRLTPRLTTLAISRDIVHEERTYASGDLAGFFLVYAATNDKDAQGRIVAEADAAGVLLNVVDRPELCNFIMPSIMRRGDLTIATSTGGTSPAMARYIRGKLERIFGPEYAVALTLLGRLRESLASSHHTGVERQRIFNALVESPLLEYLRDGQGHDIDVLLASAVGAGVSLATLGIELPQAL
jgi:precorrin-2 dehydrogenase/sirohydrochlorin ferrochelatase